MAICTYEQSLPCGYTENGKNQEFKSTKTSQTHCFGKLKRLASSTVLVYQNSSFSTVLALQKGVKLWIQNTFEYGTQTLYLESFEKIKSRWVERNH